MKKTAFWSKSLSKEINLLWLFIAFLGFFLVIIRSTDLVSAPTKEEFKNLSSFVISALLVLFIISILFRYSWQAESPAKKRSRLIKKLITEFNWVEGIDICWEYEIDQIAISDYHQNVTIKNLVPICIKDRIAYKPIEYGTLLLCTECGNKIPSIKKKEMEALIINGLKQRIVKLNEPMDKQDDAPLGYRFEGTIHLK